VTDDEKLAVHAAYAAASRCGDVDALAALSEPDAVVWHNHDDLTVPAATSNRTLAWLHRTLPDIAWEDLAVRPTSDGFVWQALMTATAPGGPLRVHTCVVVTLSAAGRVQRTEEYLDSAALAAMRPPMGSTP
jgi:ketosteroid isomerase-like protein